MLPLALLAAREALAPSPEDVQREAEQEREERLRRDDALRASWPPDPKVDEEGRTVAERFGEIRRPQSEINMYENLYRGALTPGARMFAENPDLPPPNFLGTFLGEGALDAATGGFLGKGAAAARRLMGRAGKEVVEEGVEQGAKQAVKQTREQVDGFDIAAAGAYTPEDIVKARHMWRDMGTDSPYFKRWFGNSHVTTVAGDPQIVYHGSRASVRGMGAEAAPFSAFDMNKAGFQSDAGFFGSGAYFSPNYDMASHYAGESVHLRTQRMIPRLDLPEKAAQQAEWVAAAPDRASPRHGWEHLWKAPPRAMGNFPRPPGTILPAYVSLKKPYVFNRAEGIEELIWNKGSLPDDIHIDVLNELGIGKIDDLLDNLPYDVKSREPGSAFDLASKALTSVLKKRGHDGVMVLDPDKHGRGVLTELVVFEPTQIKSAAANRGTFDPAAPRHVQMDLLGAGVTAAAARRALASEAQGELESTDNPYGGKTSE